MNMRARQQGSSGKDVVPITRYRYCGCRSLPQVLGARPLPPAPSSLLKAGFLHCPVIWKLDSGKQLFPPVAFFQIKVSRGRIGLEMARSHDCTVAARAVGKRRMASTLVSGGEIYIRDILPQMLDGHKTPPSFTICYLYTIPLSV